MAKKEKKLAILNIHAAYPSQFSPFHEYLCRTNSARSYFLCTEAARQANQVRVSNIFSYSPDGQTGSSPYYYSEYIESKARESLGILAQVQQIVEQKQIDLIVANAHQGSPYMIFDEVDVPIVTFIEFPCYRSYGFDKSYPPIDAQRYYDKNMEMIGYYCGIKSAGIITPTQWTYQMLPPELRKKTLVQTEGFDASRLGRKQNKDMYRLGKDVSCIGFTANSITSTKGYDQLIRITKEILKKRRDVHFFINGNPHGISYGYEGNLVNSLNRGAAYTYRDYVHEKEKIDLNYYTFFEGLPYADYSQFIHEMDIFLYPLQFGSNSWGLFDLLLRGKVVIASNRCYIPEIITRGKNGLMCEYEDVDEWVSTVMDVIDNKDKYATLGATAAEDGKQYHIENVAPKYMKYFEEVVGGYSSKKYK